MNLSFTALESYIASHVAAEEDAIKAKFAALLDYIKGEESKIKAEVEHLTSKGYTVVPPQPDTPQAPA